jgi:hypothetical protein
MNTTRTTSITVLPDGEPIYSEMATKITIVDEGAGEFIEVSQPGSDDEAISFSPSEWPELRAAIDSMISNCREAKK